MTESCWNCILHLWWYLAHLDDLSSKTSLKIQRSLWVSAKMRCGIRCANRPDCHYPNMCVCVHMCVSESEVRAEINHGRWLIQLDLLTYCEQLWPCLFSSLTISLSPWNTWGSWNMCAPNTHTHMPQIASPPLNSTSKPQRVKYNQSSLTMLSGHCLGAPQKRKDGGCTRCVWCVV